MYLNRHQFRNKMSLIDRIRNIIVTPKTEWLVISKEVETPTHLLLKIVIPFLLLDAAAVFIGYGFIGVDALLFKISGIKWGAWFAIRQLLAGISGYYLATYVIDMLAPAFSSEKNLGRSAQLVAYSSVPLWIMSVFSIVPTLGIVKILGLYGIYIFYLGLPLQKKTPEEKQLLYLVVSLLVSITVLLVSEWIITIILNQIIGDPYASSLNDLRNLFIE